MTDQWEHLKNKKKTLEKAKMVGKRANERA